MQAKVLKMVHENGSSDAELLAMFRNGNTKELAFNAIVNKYKERLYWHIRRMVVQHDDADDVLQETFIKMWKYLAQFRAESGLYTWLYRIATNNCITFLETKGKRTKNLVSTDTNYVANLLESEPGFDAQKIEWKLQLALASLPDKQRVVFNLRYYDEMPYEEMSEVLGTSVGALKASYHHAVKKVQAHLTEENL
jgi:RNA polymerase sigma factor (sigma-70 family)